MTLVERTTDAPTVGPSMLQAIWRHKLAFLLPVAIAGFVGFLFASQQPERWVATSSVVVEDPESSTLFAAGAVAGRPERYVENQVEIMRSDAVATRASELLAAADPPVEISGSALVSNLTVEAALTNDSIELALEAGNPDKAIAGVDALVAAYTEIRGTDAKSDIAAALQQLGEAISAIESDLASIQASIDEIRASRPAALDVLDAQYLRALQRFAILQGAGGLSDPVERDAVLFELAAIETVVAIETAQEDTLLAPLLRDEALANQRLQTLLGQRVELEVDSELTSAGVLFVDPAEEAKPVGLELGITVPIAVLVGMAIGSAIAYGLVLRRRTFSTRLEPEAVLGAPALAAIPHFAEERIPTGLAVVHAPQSATAEAFRFVAAALDAQASALRLRSFAFASADLGDGKTTVLANTALAAARGGKRVLVIDADFGSQDLIRMMSPRSFGERGLTNVAAGEPVSSGTIWQVSIGDRPSVYVMGRGNGPSTAADLFSSDVFPSLIEQLDLYDLILIDCPPLLQVAYASAIMRHVDRAVVVVPHGSSVGLIEEVRDRLNVLGTPIAGYIYNAAPIRRDLQRSGASLLDVEPAPVASDSGSDSLLARPRGATRPSSRG